MFCGSCGNQIEENSSFCPYCGNKIVSGTVCGKVSDCNNNSVASGYNNDSRGVSSGWNTNGMYDAGMYTKPTKKPAGKVALIVILSLILICGIAFGGIYFFTNGEFFSKEDTKQNSAGGGYRNDRDEDENNNVIVTQRPTEPVEDDGQEAVDSVDVQQPDVHHADTNYYVNTRTTGLYAGPGMSVNPEIGVLQYGDVVVIKGGTSVTDLWVYVYCENLDMYGWVLTIDINPDYSWGGEVIGNLDPMYTSMYSISEQFMATVSVGEGHNLNLRYEPGSENESVMVLIPDGYEIKVLGESTLLSDWYYVEYAVGVNLYYGFVSGEYLEV